MTGQVVDLVLIMAVVVFFIAGYRQGLVVGFLSFLGLIGGGVLGALLAPWVAGELLPDQSAAMVALLCTMFLAGAGQILASGLGFLLRDKVTWAPARAVDAAGGGILSAVAVLLVAWLVGTALVASPYRAPAEAVRRSAILSMVDGSLPPLADRQFAAFRRLVDTSDFPQVEGAFTSTNPADTQPPDPELAKVPGVGVAEPSIVRITGTAPSCGQDLEGTGFVYAPGRVMTNAHVVAGVRDPVVEVGGEAYQAEVVVYDPRTDVAVLLVPDLTAPALTFTNGGEAGDDAVAVGYPGGGPFTASPGRIRQVVDIKGPDIYHRQDVQREVYELRIIVRPGNSGGPLIAPDGTVYGVIFAASPDDPETGYALTQAEVADVAALGLEAQSAVSTQDCS